MINLLDYCKKIPGWGIIGSRAFAELDFDAPLARIWAHAGNWEAADAVGEWGGLSGPRNRREDAIRER